MSPFDYLIPGLSMDMAHLLVEFKYWPISLSPNIVKIKLSIITVGGRGDFLSIIVFLSLECYALESS